MRASSVTLVGLNLLTIGAVCAAASLAQSGDDQAAPAKPAAALPARSLLNQSFPPLKGKDAFTGQPIQVSAKLGQAVLVDFWESGSSSYAAGLPHIRATYETFHEKGFEIVGVSIDADANKAKAFIKANKMNWLHIVEGRGLKSLAAVNCDVRAAPMMYLLDSRGRVVWESTDATMLGGAVVRLLQQKPVAISAGPPRPKAGDDSAVATKELAEAKRLEKEGKYFTAERLYQGIVRKNPNSAAAQYAQDRIVKFQSDPKIAAAIESEKQRKQKLQNANMGKNILRMAKILIEQKKYDLPKKMLKKIIEDYPDSPEAKESKAELEKIVKLEADKQP